MNLRLSYQFSQNKDYFKKINDYFKDKNRPIYLQFDEKIDLTKIKVIFSEYFSDFPEYSCFVPNQIRQNDKQTQVSFSVFNEQSHIQTLNLTTGLKPLNIYELVTNQLKQFDQTKEVQKLQNSLGNSYTSSMMFTYGLHQNNIPATTIGFEFQNVEIFGTISLENNMYQLSIPYLDSVSLNGETRQGYFLLGDIVRQFQAQNFITWTSQQFSIINFKGISYNERNNYTIKSLQDVQKVNFQPQTTLLFLPSIKQNLNEFINLVKQTAFNQYKPNSILFELTSYTSKNNYITLIFKSQKATFLDQIYPVIDLNFSKTIVSASPNAKQTIANFLAQNDAKTQQKSTFKWIQNDFYCVFVVSTQEIHSFGTCNTTNGYRYYKQFLTLNQQQILQKIVISALKIRPEVNFPLELKVVQMDLKIVQKVLQLDFPELFFVEIRKFAICDGFVSSCEILTNDAKIEQQSRNLTEIGNSLIQQFKTQNLPLSEFFQNFVHKNVKYEERNAERTQNLHYEHNAVGCLIDRKCVCQGIAAGYKFLCDLIAQKCVHVIGDGNGRAHSWVVQEIGSKWYNIDFTWNLTSKTNLYLNAPDYLMRKHQVDGQFQVPVCDSLGEYYYQKMGLFCVDRIQAKQAVLKQLQSGQIKLVLWFQVGDYAQFIQELFCEISFDISQVIAPVKISVVSEIMFVVIIEEEKCQFFQNKIHIGRFLGRGIAKDVLKNVKGEGCKLKYVQIGEYFKCDMI